MKVSLEEISNVRVVKNNISKHVYDIGNYPLSKRESEIVVRALKLYLQQLERTQKDFDKTTV